MSQSTQTIRLQIADEQHAANIIACCESQELYWEFKEKGRIIQVESDDPVQFYYLGANVAARGTGLFEGPLTSQK